MGSWVAFHTALLAPERVRGMVLIGALHRLAAQPGMSELLAAVHDLDDPVDREFITEFQRSTVHQPIPEGFLQLVVDESAKLPAAVWRRCFDALVVDDPEPRLGEIDVPVRLLWGAHDDVTGHDGQLALVRALPQAHLVAYPEFGHAPHWEDPVRVAADIAGFAGALLAGGRSAADSAVQPT
ncbi:alpha/beta fold hydrolase [Euzebya sp.]|uniref:alpha/beta fold hydrolase n=1 Tax=Euzebya sp. TaxID=1971409 RepID=UPI0035155CEE